MSEDVYATPDLTKKVRYGPRDREGETEDRGDWEDRIVDIYATADYPNPGPKPAPGTQQDAARNNTAQQQRGAPKESKQNLYLAVVVALCLLLLAGIIVLLILYGPLIKEKHILQSRMLELETRLNMTTDQRDQCKTRLNDTTTKLDDLKSKMIRCETHGFTVVGDGCYYYYSTEWKTWDDSRAYCTARQSDLMTMKTTEKKDFVHRLVGNKWVVWIGLTDSETEGVWKWVDGTPLTTPYWGGGQPDDYGEGEDCVWFHNGQWTDIPCAGKGWTKNWICEIVF